MTWRPVTVEIGTNRLVVSERETLVEAAREVLNDFNPSVYGRPERWDGRAAERIVGILCTGGKAS